MRRHRAGTGAIPRHLRVPALDAKLRAIDLALDARLLALDEFSLTAAGEAGAESDLGAINASALEAGLRANDDAYVARERAIDLEFAPVAALSNGQAA